MKNNSRCSRNIFWIIVLNLMVEDSRPQYLSVIFMMSLVLNIALIIFIAYSILLTFHGSPVVPDILSNHWMCKKILKKFKNEMNKKIPLRTSVE